MTTKDMIAYWREAAERAEFRIIEMREDMGRLERKIIMLEADAQRISQSARKDWEKSIALEKELRALKEGAK